MLTINQYVKASSLEEAYELNQKKSNVILGGMLWLKMQKRNVGTAIDLSGLGLDAIEETEEAYRIGAMVTLRQLELHRGTERPDPGRGPGERAPHRGRAVPQYGDRGRQRVRPVRLFRCADLPDGGRRAGGALQGGADAGGDVCVPAL